MPKETTTNPRKVSAAALKLAAMRAEGDKRWRRIVIEALETTGSVRAAALRLGMGKTALQRWINEDPTLLVGLELRGAGNPNWVRKKAAER